MNTNFCLGCDEQSQLPKCAICNAPNNAYIEDIIKDKSLNKVENFVCHKAAQEISSRKLSITNKCDECALCMISCPKYNISDISELFTLRLEKVIFSDLGKTCILFQALFPSATVATKVQVKGNFRTKRIDLMIKKDDTLLLIKMLKSYSKLPFYSRSYDEVILHYHALYPNLNIVSAYLVPSAKIDTKLPYKATIYDINGLYSALGGK